MERVADVPSKDANRGVCVQLRKRMVVPLAFSLEPDIIKGTHPEDSFQTGLLQELLGMLSSLQGEGKIDEFFILLDFGFDLGVFISRDGHTNSIFFNLKMYMGARPRVVEIGDQKGSGAEMELMQLNTSRSAMASGTFRWILVDITKPKGNRRYSIFTTDQAKEGLMGGINKKKQNSIKLGSVMTFSLTWDELSGKISQFLSE